MPKLTNPKHELYAQERFKGASARAAGKTAGYSQNSLAGLRRRADIKARIQELHGAPVGIGDLIRMWQEALERAIDRKDLVTEGKCLRMITILSGQSVKGDPLRMSSKDRKHPKRKGSTKAEREQHDRDEPDDGIEPEEAHDGDPDTGPTPDISTLDRQLGRLDDDARTATETE